MTTAPVQTSDPGRPSRRPFARLTVVDRMFLHDERAAWPCHFGGLAIVDGRALTDGGGRVGIAELRDHLGRRLAAVPDLRQRLYAPGMLRGGPLWVDDEDFAIERHLHEATVDPPGGDAQLLEAAARIYAGLLDRTRPLWELWILSGLSDDRVGILVKIHHAVADGSAAVAIVSTLFDIEPGAPDRPTARWSAAPLPSGWALFAENLAAKSRAGGRLLAAVRHPRPILEALRMFALVLRRSAGQQGAPRTSLNGVVGVGRRVRVLRLDLAEMKAVGHAHGGKLNDLVLDLWAGGLRRLLLSRGEPVEGIEIKVGQAVSLRSASDGEAIDNQAGTIVLPLPVGEADPNRRLDRIVATTRRTKAIQQPAAIMNVTAALAATPLGAYMNLHQRAVNVMATNVVGPPLPMYVLGARVLELLPIIQLVGNVGLTVCAFSYAGSVALVVTADAGGFPDVDELVAGMEAEWRTLAGTPAVPTPERVSEPVPA
jgi:WS/DGAT/MGAT family acyltransferase